MSANRFVVVWSIACIYLSIAALPHHATKWLPQYFLPFRHAGNPYGRSRDWSIRFPIMASFSILFPTP